jgi:hypothetical protein
MATEGRLGRRIALDAVVIVLALAAALAFFFVGPTGTSTRVHGVAGANPNMMPPPPPPNYQPPPPNYQPPPPQSQSCPPGYTYYYSSVNGHVTSGCRPNNSSPPPPPPAGNFTPPPARTATPPPPPAGDFAPDIPAASAVTPTASVTADPPAGGISSGITATLSNTKLIDVPGSPKPPNRGAQAAGVALGVAGLATAMGALSGGAKTGAGFAVNKAASPVVAAAAATAAAAQKQQLDKDIAAYNDWDGGWGGFTGMQNVAGGPDATKPDPPTDTSNLPTGPD